MMTKEEFLYKAVLQMLTAPRNSLEDIVKTAKELTDLIFSDHEPEKESGSESWFDKELDKKPSSEIISYIERNSRPGYANRLAVVFRKNDIDTVGDLLRIGKRCFRKYRNVGGGSIMRINDALEDLYGILYW